VFHLCSICGKKSAFSESFINDQRPATTTASQHKKMALNRLNQVEIRFSLVQPKVCDSRAFSCFALVDS
jgi:hypothetical protein